METHKFIADIYTKYGNQYERALFSSKGLDTVEFHKQVYSDVAKALKSLKALQCPECVKDEVGIILRESKDLRFSWADIISDFDELIEYEEKQKIHLSSIKNKLGQQDSFYLHASSVVVEYIMLYIILGLSCTEDHIENKMMLAMKDQIRRKPSVIKIYRQAYDLVHTLDAYDKEYKYNYDRFTPCKKDILDCCNQYYTFTKPKTKFDQALDVSKDVAVDTAGCVAKMFVFTIIAMIIVAIVNEC